MFRKVGELPSLGWEQLSIGFAGAWLAFSGVETLAQLAPAVREPRTQVIRVATGLLIVSVVVTAPLFTALAVEVAGQQPGARSALLAPVALAAGGRPLLVALALTAAALLLWAAHIAFVGCYNVFQALGEQGYLPAVVARRHPQTGAPRGAAIVITAAAFILVTATGADLPRLGQLFAFGLLGSYSISSVSVDVLRWREGQRGPKFALGVLATLAVVVPWLVSSVSRWQATAYSGVVAGTLLVVGLITRRGWIRADRFGYLRAASAEDAAAGSPGAGDVLTLHEAMAVRDTYPASTLIALRSANKALCREAARRARGLGETAVHVIYVDEIPGLLFPSHTTPSDEARRVLKDAAADLRAEGIDAVPVWRLAHDAGASIAETAEALGTRCVLMGTPQRSAVWHLLRGNVLKRLMAELPEGTHVVICE